MNKTKNISQSSIMINLGSDEMVAIETIKRCKRIGNYTQVWIWGEDNFRDIWDESKNLWVTIQKANNMMWELRQSILL